MFHHSIPYERGREIIKIIACIFHCLFSSKPKSCHIPSAAFYRLQSGDPVRIIDILCSFQKSFYFTVLHDFDKILIYIDKMADGERFFKETEDVFNHIDRLGGVYECVQKEYSKATAIEYIQKELHLADDEIYAFGDSSNDLDMIKAAGHGVIMGHHDPVLEPYAEYITDTVENDGLYKAMEHYGLI